MAAHLQRGGDRQGRNASVVVGYKVLDVQVARRNCIRVLDGQLAKNPDGSEAKRGL